MDVLLFSRIVSTSYHSGYLRVRSCPTSESAKATHSSVLFLIVDVDIQKPDTGYLSVIERPPSHPSSKFSTQAGPTPLKTPTATSSISGSGGTNSPITLVPHYTEPLSEGEEDEDEIVAAKDEEDETKRTGLGAEEVKAAIAYREKMLKERREEEEEENKREKKAGKDKDTGAIEGTLSSSEVVVAADEMTDTEADVSALKNGKRSFHDRSTVSRNLRTRALDINPLAPSSAFDETLKTKLAGAQEREESLRLRGKKDRNDLVEDKEGEGDDADALNGLSGPSRQIDDEWFVDRNWGAPKGKRIAVPVRIEPKVYFAAERTFLVCVSLSRILFLFHGRVFSFVLRNSDSFIHRNGSIMPCSLALLQPPFSILFRLTIQEDSSVQLCLPCLLSSLLPTLPEFLSIALTNSERKMRKGCTTTSTAQLCCVAHCSLRLPQTLDSDGVKYNNP